MTMQQKTEPEKMPNVPVEAIAQRIYIIRGQKVILDQDLALLYQVSTKRLNEQVKRNIKRFPHDFLFILTLNEAEALRSQIATSKKGRGGRRNQPLAFTEHGVAMLSSVLNSERAIQVNIAIMRAFSKLRDLLSSNKDLLRKVQEMERKYDSRFLEVFRAIRQLTPDNDDSDRGKIGFATENKKQPESPYR
jgi:hypothetical protein